MIRLIEKHFSYSVILRRIALRFNATHGFMWSFDAKTISANGDAKMTNRGAKKAKVPLKIQTATIAQLARLWNNATPGSQVRRQIDTECRRLGYTTSTIMGLHSRSVSQRSRSKHLLHKEAATAAKGSGGRGDGKTVIPQHATRGRHA